MGSAVFSIQAAWYIPRDADGYYAVTASNGDQTGTPMVRAVGIKALDTSIPDGDRKTQSGDGGPMFQKLVESSSLPGGEMSMAILDLTLDSVLQGVSNDTIAGATVGYLGVSLDTLIDIALLVHVELQDVDTGASKWLTLLMPSAQAKSNFGSLQINEYTDIKYSVSMNKTLIMPWGANASKSVAIRPIVADEPVLMHGWQADGVVVVYNLPYVPTADGDVSVYVNGALQVITTNYTLSGAALTLIAAGADGDEIRVVWQVDNAVLYS